MNKWITNISGLLALIAAISGGLLYFVPRHEFSALAENVEKNSKAISYDQAIRQYTFYQKKSEEYPNDKEIKEELERWQSRVRRYECELYGEGCPEKEDQK